MAFEEEAGFFVGAVLEVVAEVWGEGGAGEAGDFV